VHDLPIGASRVDRAVFTSVWRGGCTIAIESYDFRVLQARRNEHEPWHHFLVLGIPAEKERI